MTDDSPASIRGRLFRRYALLINALVGTLLVAGAALSLTFSYRESHDHLIALQTELAQGAAARIEQYVADIEQQLGWTALSGMNAGGDPLELRRIDYLKLLRQVPAITEAAWLDPQGREQVRVSRLTMDAQGQAIDRSGELVFTEPMAGRVWRSAVSFRKQTEPYITVAKRAGPGRGSGVTVVEVNLKFVWDVVARIHPGEGGLAYATDQTGALIAHPDISLVLKQTNLAALPQVAASLKEPQGATSRAHAGNPEGDRTVDGAHDLEGRSVLSAWARLEPLGWRVFVESPRSQALQPVYASLQRLGLLLAAGLLVSVVASAWLARALVRPIRSLQEGATRIAAGDLDHRISISSGGELQAHEFNRMATELKAAYVGLEQKVATRTAELADALAQQTAIADLVKAMSRTSFQLEALLHALIENATSLCKADKGFVYLREGEDYVMRVNHGSAPEQVDMRPLRPAMGTLVGRTALLHQPVAIDDAVTDPSYTWKEAQQRLGFRSMLGVPLLRDGEPIGVIALWRDDVRPFNERDQRLVATFADQAVIAIENARLFEQLQAKTEQLEVAGRHKSEFLANMSHELRTPLNAIIGFSEVLAEQMFGTVNAKQLEYLKDIHSSGQHLLTLINDVLDLSKVEAGRMELALARADVAQVLESAMNLVRERATRQGLTLALVVDVAVETWVLDERKIKQVLLNLLSNAVKFTPPGGRVDVRARCPDPGRLEIAVIDTGSGIAPQDQGQIFEEFRQASGNYLRKAEGTGLGLALARHFVELHGGRLSLQSTPGQGSTFTFTLPAFALEPA
jgi:signal transduction histidine kinase/HAMP domain-containing protein